MEDENHKVELGFEDGSIGATIMWNNTKSLEESLKDPSKLSVTKLPTINIGGEDKQLKAFVISNDIVINRLVPNATLAKDFAKYASSKESQELRLTLSGNCPSNVELLSSEVIKSYKFAYGVSQMILLDAVIPQSTSINSKFWDPIMDFNKIIMQYAKSGTPWGNYSTAKEALDAMCNSMQQ